MNTIILFCTFEYAYQLISKLPKPAPGYTWAVCAGWPDARIKTIWLHDYRNDY